MPRDAPVTSAILLVNSSMCPGTVGEPGVTASRRDLRDEALHRLEVCGAFEVGHARRAVDLSHQTAQHRAGTHFNIRADARGRKPPHHVLPAYRRRHLATQRLDP